MNGIKIFFPFTYFFFTRLKSVREAFYHGYYEWLISILILLYIGNFTILQSFINFAFGYLAFICIYEIGYLINDVYSINDENAPRKRLGDYTPSNGFVCLWLLVRLGIFGLITWQLKLFTNNTWILFYVALIISFLLHNFIKNKELRVISFTSLAFLRFLAPFFIFIPAHDLSIIVPCAILNYVIYRTLSYMASKNILVMESRKTPMFRLGYYLILVPISLWLSVFFNSFAPILFNLYYALYVLFYLKELLIKK